MEVRHGETRHYDVEVRASLKLKSICSEELEVGLCNRP